MPAMFSPGGHDTCESDGATALCAASKETDMLHLILPNDSLAAHTLRMHVPPRPDPIPPGSPPGDLPVDPDTDEPEVDLPPGEPETPQKVQ